LDVVYTAAARLGRDTPRDRPVRCEAPQRLARPGWPSGARRIKIVSASPATCRFQPPLPQSTVDLR